MALGLLHGALFAGKGRSQSVALYGSLRLSDSLGTQTDMGVSPSTVA